jgi:ADP-heptose:LPS heptosyltransferase
VKVLVVRFSSLGDIVLTSPVLRCIKTQRPDITLHFCCKKSMLPAIQHNPYIDKILTFDKDFGLLISQIKSEKYDLLIDLHHNLRTLRLKIQTAIPSKSFNKINFNKWMAVRFKILNQLPDKHLVDRYMKTVSELSVQYDGNGLDFFTGEEQIPESIQISMPEKFHVYAIGGQHATKRLPIVKMKELIELSSLPVVLIGGENDVETAGSLKKEFKDKVYNFSGLLSLAQSALLIKKAVKVITHDSVMMHIAAAFDKDLISIWGNTIPEFGMYPCFAENSKAENTMLEVKNLPCRPCSKIGFDACPKSHFDCMNKIDFSHVKSL